MRYAVAILGAAAFVVAPAFGDDQGPKPASSGVESDSKAQSADEQAIRTSAEAFTRAYNAGDAHALAEQFSKNADVIDGDGVRIRGREAIEQALAATFKEEPGDKIALAIDSLRFISPDVALEEGRNTVTPAGGAPVSRRHLVIHIKQDGRWYMDSVREAKDLVVRPHDRLKELEWMLGEWTDEGSDSIVRTKCHWSKDENFLLRDITVQVQGATATSITQRIGWDPLTERFKSWEFDSEGGHSEGLWARAGEKNWVVKHAGVLPDGRTSSATRVIVLETPNRVRWASIDRVVGGEALPEEMSFLMVKIPPAPGTQEGEKAAPSTTPARDKR
ncbi:YybH family protein [Singulisphaera acidiphila]|uniref:DUF4440 domain-containing protein n=1 Tax=Singulisphaera acidiphila (strain ATCC BAA-1392 / DSM 18658 / VKM B-2454 / MOB10) TaxID=886293 RepID=L0D8K1_SINAD|nr:SgcJ/EcaC family oxidoreductase [Singulisphaera acidiphila]AGA25195.1 hypothetical protein Sinac_0786 [Singulisphaera acidiphila DSM 18658]